MKLQFRPVSSHAELDALVASAPLPEPLQMAAWAKVKAGEWQAQRYGIYADGELVGAYQLLMRRLPVVPLRIAYSSRGPVFSKPVPPDYYVQVARHMERTARAHRAIVLHYDPPVRRCEGRELYRRLRARGYAHLGFHFDMREIQPRCAMMLELPGHAEDIEAALSKKLRQRIRRAAKRPFVISQVDSAGLAEFSALMQAMAKRQQIAMRGESYYRRILEAFGPNAEACVISLDRKATLDELEDTLRAQERELESATTSAERARSQAKQRAARRRIEQAERVIEKTKAARDELEGLTRDLLPLACSLIITCGKRAFYIYGASGNELRDYGAVYVLLADRMRHLVDSHGGPVLFDFGGVSGQTDASKDPDHGGLFEFKSKWGAEMVEFVGEFVKPTVPGIGHLFVHATRAYKKGRDLRHRLARHERKGER